MVPVGPRVRVKGGCAMASGCGGAASSRACMQAEGRVTEGRGSKGITFLSAAATVGYDDMSALAGHAI